VLGRNEQAHFQLKQARQARLPYSEISYELGRITVESLAPVNQQSTSKSSEVGKVGLPALFGWDST
jgi:hypothetical protein